jgi:hypothetical protein
MRTAKGIFITETGKTSYIATSRYTKSIKTWKQPPPKECTINPMPLEPKGEVRASALHATTMSPMDRPTITIHQSIRKSAQHTPKKRNGNGPWIRT